MIQMIFQDPYASLNPRLKVMDIITEPMAVKAAALGKAEIREKAMELLNRVGLGPEHVNRYPHQFSGGQRQRIGIARALSVEPQLVIADEPVSALDVSIQAQILNLMMDLKDEFGFSYLFITHDLSVVRHISDRIGVMYLGYLVETGPSDDVFLSPRHPYTQALLSAAPSVNEKLQIKPLDIKGEVPTALELPPGCSFQTRCPFAFDRCAQERPRLISRVSGRKEACHLLEA
jgi:peptide/nickel transport system ATP-binding protein/oligopeptide transport system ATP-binding protein